MSDYLEVIDRARRMQDFEVQVTVPEDFQFSGAVPYDMEILGNQAFVTVIAASLTEARSRVEEYFNFKE